MSNNHSNDHHVKANSAKKDAVAENDSDPYGFTAEEDDSFSPADSKQHSNPEDDVQETNDGVESKRSETNEGTDMEFSEEDFVELSEAERILDERNLYLDSLQRLQADFDNFRKRTLRQQAESKELAHAQLIEKLLPVLDAFELAVSHIDNNLPSQAGDPEEPSPSGKTSDNYASGNDEKESSTLKSFMQIRSLLEDTLSKEGLTRIGNPGEQFNPSYHDAVSHEPTDSLEEAGIIIDVFRSGYKLKDRVLRPAMVKVKG